MYFITFRKLNNLSFIRQTIMLLKVARLSVFNLAFLSRHADSSTPNSSTLMLISAKFLLCFSTLTKIFTNSQNKQEFYILY